MRPKVYLAQLIHVVVGLAEIALVLRIFMRLFAANPTASFVHWTYATSDTLLQPFRGVFPTTVIDKAHVLDFTALFAVIVYAILGAVLVYVVAAVEAAVTSPKSKR